MRVLVTGAGGFVGRELCAELMRRRYEVRAALRTRSDQAIGNVQVPVGGLDAATDWSAALREVDVVVHLAARVHVMNETDANPIEKFRQINVDGTLHLARSAARAGVKRLVYISTVKVNGEATSPNKPYTEADAIAPQDPYAVSKAEAECGLKLIAQSTPLEVVIIRPPLVYGPGVKANFAALMRAVARRWPLPLASVHNRRSMVSLGNLVDFIVTCINHPQAANEIFLVSDGDDQSTPDLIRGLARAQGVQPRVFPFPLSILQAIAALAGKRMAVERLCGNLQVDISKARNVLQWTPPVSVEEGLRRAAGDTSHL
ncbi:SDR family oxidoreductase [Rhodoferax sp. GW822-FHT02A01]|uniref:UDP-glucose 4-epimerase family protein n=1 Tax=Rhodoferax sp. GW822-FHT02A01 TaxID=3141537 RepID=UPI00315CE41D